MLLSHFGTTLLPSATCSHCNETLLFGLLAVIPPSSGAPPLSSGEATPPQLSSCYAGGADPPLPKAGLVPQARPIRAQRPVPRGLVQRQAQSPRVGEPPLCLCPQDSSALFSTARAELVGLNQELLRPAHPYLGMKLRPRKAELGMARPGFLVTSPAPC